ncbi:MAG: ABC transporter permease [Deltaproteobacteria bacterium]|nr:MAG: ABC transporter permease [Deltaproteobacteria bacterium]
MTGFEWMLLVLLSVVWGGSFFFNGIALREFPTLSIVTARVGLAALALLFLMKMLGQGIQLNRQILKAFFGMSFLNNVVPFSLIVWGQQHIASGVASILNATTPLFTMLVAHWFTTDEKINPRRLLGVLTGMGGVGLMMGLDSMESSGFHLLGQSAILLAAFSYGLAGVYGKRFAQLEIPPLATATGQLCASSMILIPLTLWIDQPWTIAMPSIEGMGSLLGIALLSTALAYVIYFRLLKTAGATNLLLVTLLIPVSAIILGVFLLDESLEPQHLSGMAVISLGLLIMDGRLLQFFRKTFPA